MIEVAGRDARGACEAILACRERAARAEAEEFAWVAHLADVYSTGGLIQVGGDGTPEADEYLCVELAALLKIAVVSATVLIRDALDVRHRLPRAWEAIFDGRLRVWHARRLAPLLAPLTRHQARWVDEHLAPSYGRVSLGRLLRLAEGLVVQADVTAADERAALAQDRRGVWINAAHGQVGDAFARADAVDLLTLDASLNQLAEALRAQGATESPDALRSRALGVLALPALALQTLQRHLQPQLPDESGCFGHTCGAVTVPTERLLPKVTLFAHVAAETVAGGVAGGDSGVLRTSAGPLTPKQFQSFVGSRRVVVRPVIDLAGVQPVDCYEIPQTTRAAVLLRDPVEAFPSSSRVSTRLDLDHTIAWSPGGPRGQTRPGNLAPLSRRVHRAKTFGGWRLTQPEPGSYHWRSPLGFEYWIGRDGRSQPPPELAA